MPRPSIVIPTRNPGAAAVRELEHRLWGQTLEPQEVVVIDSDSTDGSPAAWSERVHVSHIPVSEFNHGGTRNRAAAGASGDVLVFMTQDALPADERWLAALLAPLDEPRVAAAYARQLPAPDATLTERFARSFNYGTRSEVRCPGGDDHVRRVFFSNVSSAVRTDAFRSLGGFPAHVLMNEDMIFAVRLLAAGHCVAYAAESCVIHSHDYTLAEQFRRYFDIGAVLRRQPDLREVRGTEGEGLRFVVEQARWLVRQGAWSALPGAAVEAAAKYAGFRLGRLEPHLPTRVKRRLSMHAFFWR